MRMRTKAPVAALAMALGLALAVPGAVVAQDAEGQSAPKTNWSDTKLEGFVTAAVAVQDVYENWRPRIDNAENAEEQQKLRQQANDQAVSAVEESPITVKEYTQINRAMQTDPEFYKKVRGMLDEAQ